MGIPQIEALDRVCAIAKVNTSIGSARVFQGYARFGDADNLEQWIITSGAPATSGGAAWFFAHLDTLEARNNMNVADLSNFEIRAGLLVYIPKDASTNMNPAWEICASLVSGLHNPAYYSGGLAPAVVRAKWAGMDLEFGGGQIAKFDFGAYEAGGAITFVDP